MGANYLKKYYLKDHKLAQRARLEFFRSLSTGRMIAFTGSMATQASGYGGWEQLRMMFSALAGDAADRLTAEARRTTNLAGEQAAVAIKDHVKNFEKRSAAGDWSGPVSMSLIEEALDQWEGALPPKAPATGAEAPWPLDQFETVREGMRIELAKRFRNPDPLWRIDRTSLPPQTSRSVSPDFDKTYNVINGLWRGLGIRRFATPSYDFEIEAATMLTDQAGAAGGSPFDQLVALRGADNENFSWDLGSGRIRRVFADGWAVESDLMNRERIDRMIEFAVGADDVDGHAMHLHGRACNWRSMIASQSDYDALYRRNDLNRAPFEFAKRMMMGGNPILFVGLGMSENELNREMHEFVSNNPYQRVAPTFLLWSARPEQLDEGQRAIKRIDYLRRLGILTIFDSDFADLDAQEPGYEKLGKRYEAARSIFIQDPTTNVLKSIDFDKADRSNREDLQDLKICVDRLCTGIPIHSPHAPSAQPSVNPTLRERFIGTRWRSMSGRVTAMRLASKPVSLWQTRYSGTEPALAWLPDLLTAVRGSRMLCIIGPQGSGKGRAARALADNGQQIGLALKSDCMLINGGFAYDTDTMLDGVARFFSETLASTSPLADNTPPERCRSEFFKSLNLAEDRARPPTAMVIINGMDRFVDLAGAPLSAELDELLSYAGGRGQAASAATSSSQAAKTGPAQVTSTSPKMEPPVRWVIFGTERIRKHMIELGADVRELSEFVDPPDLATGHGTRTSIPGDYLNSVWSIVSAHIPNQAMIWAAADRYDANRTGKISSDSTELRRALFGAVFDESVLSKILRSNRPLASTRTAREILKALAFIGLAVERGVLELMPGLKQAENFDDTFEALRDANLVLEIDGYRCPKHAGAAPPFRFALHRTLLTELRYRYGIPLSEAKLSTAFNMSLYVAQPIDGDIPDTDIHDDLGKAIDRLIGSYRLPDKDAADLGAMAANLGLSVADYERLLRDTATACGASKMPEDLTEIQRLCSERHVRALRTALALVRSYYSTTGLLTLDTGDRLIREGRDGVLLEHAERLDDLIDAYGKMSLARTDLRSKLKTFSTYFGDSEPFYPDELVWLHNERGVVRLAMGDLYEARRSFDHAMSVNRQWVERNDQAHNWRRIRLNQLTVDIEMGDISLAERKCEELIRVSKNKPHGGLREDHLARAIATGYQGWCLHLRGQVDRALEQYQAACNKLSELAEVRAQAYFERLYANALGSASKPEERLATLERALYLAQSAMQMDIVHRLQITLADTYLFSVEPTPPRQRQRAHRYLEEALSYALTTDVHRVRCEASMATARARLGISDFDGALRYAMDAMMVATRYGMELRKISLRALIAKAMAARGHPVTAEHLARTCIKMATRQRYQTAIDEAAQVIMDIPRISAAISGSDRSGRRNF